MAVFVQEFVKLPGKAVIRRQVAHAITECLCCVIEEAISQVGGCRDLISQGRQVTAHLGTLHVRQPGEQMGRLDSAVAPAGAKLFQQAIE